MNLKKLIKPLILPVLYQMKYFEVLRYFQKKRVTILMYHRFSENHEPFKIQKTIFENQIKFLKKRYNFISLSYYGEFLIGKRNSIPMNSIIITIDDGYKDNYDYAYQVLKKHSIPATIFITTDFINKRSWLWFNKLKYIMGNTSHAGFEIQLGKNTKKFSLDSFANNREAKLSIFNYCKSIKADEIDDLLDQLADRLEVIVPKQTAGDFQPLTWEQIKEMQQNRIEFGSHTCSHPILSRLNQNELKKEIITSKEELSHKLGTEINTFCYPVGKPGDINNDVLKTTSEAGYHCAVTTIAGSNRGKYADRLLLKRISTLTDNEILLSKIISIG